MIDQSIPKVAVVTGAGGTLCSAMAIDLASKGYKVALIGRTLESLQQVETEIKKSGGTAISIVADVCSQDQIENAKLKVDQELGTCTVLINGAGGNRANAITTINEFDEEELKESNPDLRGFFNLDMKHFLDVIEVNTMGTVVPSFVFAKGMAEKGGGVIVNFASMNTYRPLSRVPAYALSKAGISNFTQWLAAYLAPAKIRVNAIAPGFFLNDRSKKLLITPDGSYSERGAGIIRQTPMKKFGEAEELVGCMNWLIDDKAAGFVTGTTIPVDGGFLSCTGI